MMKAKQRKGLHKVAAGILCSILLLAWFPLSAAAVEYTPLATIRKGLRYPIDVAVSDSGKIYVVDGITKKVLIYNGNSVLTGSISSLGNPTAIAVSGTTVLVADNESKTVKKLNSSGAVIGALQKGGADATFNLAQNIAVGATGSIFVVDQYANTIEVFDAAGNYASTISGLSMPQDAVAVGNELFIVDQPLQATTSTTTDAGGNVTTHTDPVRLSRIQIFDLDANAFVTDEARAFPGYGTDASAGQHIRLKGIAADPHDFIYVNDSYLNTIYKFDTNGGFIGSINAPVTTPLGTVVADNGSMVITSSYDGIVRVLGVDPIAGNDSWNNDTPVANAGENQVIGENTTVILDASGSTDADGIANYRWTQTSGINVLDENPLNTDVSQVSFTAPNVGPEGAELVFELVVTDSNDNVSSGVVTTVTVTNVISGSVVINDGALYTNDQDVTLSLDASEAVEMRFSNDNDPFDGTVYPYFASGDWTLSAGDGSKTVNVEFIDAGGNATVASSSIILDTEAPVSPAVIDTGGAAGEFDWSPVEDAASYTVQYASNSNFVGAVTISGLDFNGVTIQLDGLASGTWYWRVQSVDVAGNTSEWSSPLGTFIVGADCSASPDAPQLALPFDNAPDVFRTAILEANAMTYPGECGDHMRTEWQVSETADFSTLVLSVGTTMENLVVYQVPALVLAPETSYFWRVKYVASNGKESGWSEVWTFTTAADYDVEGVDGVLYVQPDGSQPPADGEEITIKEVVGDADMKIKVIRVSAGVSAKTIQDLDPNTIPETVNRPASFPLGLLSFRMAVAPGDSAVVAVVFSKAAPSDVDWYAYNVENGWYAYEGAVFSQNRRTVTLTFQDGGIGDTDGIANGIIVNP